MSVTDQQKLFQEVWLRVYLSVASSGRAIDPATVADKALSDFQDRFHPQASTNDDDIPF